MAFILDNCSQQILTTQGGRIMLQKQDYFQNACKYMLIILCSLSFTSIGLAQSWTSKAPMPTARSWLSTSVVNNNIYAIGGATAIGSNLDAVEAFDPLTNTWTTKTPMPTPRGCAAACAVDGIIYVFGGGWYTVDSTVEAYDPSNDTWTTKSPMPTARSGLSVCVVDSIIYAISGFTDMNNPLSTNTVEAYDPKTDTWTMKAPIPTVRAYFSASVVNGIIYTFGGFNGIGTPSLGNVEAYDPVSNIWTIKNDMPIPKAGMASYAFGGNIYCFGGVGYGGGPCYSTISKYYPASDTWEEFSDMPYAAFSISSSSLNGKLYFIGGLNDARTPLDIVYECDPPIVLPVELNVKSLDKFALEQNYPNPFNPSTTIKFSVPKLSFVTIKIYDVLGSEVAALVNEEIPAGTYELNWNAANLPSGVYFYQLKADSYVETKKMILLK